MNLKPKDPSADDEDSEIKRPLMLYVTEVMTTVPDNLERAGKAPLRHIRLEMSKIEASRMLDLLTQQIESHIPGAVTVQCRGHLVV